MEGAMKTGHLSLRILCSAILFFALMGLSMPWCHGQETPIFKHKLDNGVSILQAASDRNDIVCICVVLNLSVYDEREQRVGIRSLVSDLLMEKICSKTTAKGTRVLELMGVLTEAETTPDYMTLTFFTRPSDYRKVLELVAEELQDYHFDEALFKREKDLFIEKLEGGGSGFSSIYDIFLQSFYRYHPYKLSEEPNPKGLKSVKKEDLEKFLSTTLQSDKIIISITGNIDPEEVCTLVENKFSKFSHGKSSRVEVQWEPQATQKEIFLSSLSKMAWLLVGYPAPSYGSPDYPAMKVLQTILGEGLNSRLWVELREKRGFAYELGSFYPELEGPSHVLIYVAAQPQNIISTRRLVYKEIRSIQSGGVQGRELTDAKAKIRGSLLLQRESSKGQALDMAVAQIIGGRYALDINLARKIDEVGSDDVRKVAIKYFQEATLLVVRPPGAFYIDWFE